MKNFGSILTLLAVSASVVSARALTGPNSQVVARAPYSYVDNVARSPEKDKDVKANETITADPSLTTGVVGANPAEEPAASANMTATSATGKKAKGSTIGKNSTDTATGQPSMSTATPTQELNPDEEDQLVNIIEGLTGIKLDEISRRGLPQLESRHKKNETGSAGAAAPSTTGTPIKRALKARPSERSSWVTTILARSTGSPVPGAGAAPNSNCTVSAGEAIKARRKASKIAA